VLVGINGDGDTLERAEQLGCHWHGAATHSFKKQCLPALFMDGLADCANLIPRVHFFSHVRQLAYFVELADKFPQIRKRHPVLLLSSKVADEPS
jgi:hypothetical protein